MTRTTFALIRHGQTDWNAERRLQGSADIPLNDVGRQQALDAVAALSIYEWDVVVSSPLSRASETADLIADGLGLSVTARREALQERNYGLAEGLQAGPELEAMRIPGGFKEAEDAEATARRGLCALEELAADFPGQRILVVSHGTLLRLSLGKALGQELPGIENAVLNVAHHRQNHDGSAGWEIEFFNGERAELAA
ncbi:histidine phosphatase family protein [Pseudarthrobacter sp. J1763]|uniref:histidine phosphatase family protein n=1 Tax=Pseudarthrobacter sp. J1763 TaxID=3420445 RepID=UPI003D289F3D